MKIQYDTCSFPSHQKSQNVTNELIHGPLLYFFFSQALVKAKFYTQGHLNNLHFCCDTLSLISYYADRKYKCKNVMIKKAQ